MHAYDAILRQFPTFAPHWNLCFRLQSSDQRASIKFFVICSSVPANRDPLVRLNTFIYFSIEIRSTQIISGVLISFSEATVSV